MQWIEFLIERGSFFFKLLLAAIMKDKRPFFMTGKVINLRERRKN